MKIGPYEVSQTGTDEWKKDLAVVGLGGNTYYLGILDRVDADNPLLSPPRLGTAALLAKRVQTLYGAIRMVSEAIPAPGPGGQIGIAGVQALTPIIDGDTALLPQVFIGEWTLLLTYEGMGDKLADKLAKNYLSVADPSRIATAQTPFGVR